MCLTKFYNSDDLLKNGYYGIMNKKKSIKKSKIIRPPIISIMVKPCFLLVAFNYAEILQVVFLTDNF